MISYFSTTPIIKSEKRSRFLSYSLFKGKKKNKRTLFYFRMNQTKNNKALFFYAKIRCNFYYILLSILR